MVCIRGVLGFGLACVVVACADPDVVTESGAGGSEGETDVDDDPEPDDVPSCLTDDDGECVECRPDVADSCAEGLTCVEWACADLCVDIGGAWIGTRLRHWHLSDYGDGEDQMSLDLQQVQGNPTDTYTACGPEFTEVPANAVGLAGTLDGEELLGWVSRTDGGGARVCIEVREGHDLSFYTGQLDRDCTTIFGSFVEYAANGSFALVRSGS